MYRNRMQFCGNLTSDPKTFEPRTEGDKVMFSYTVCQSFPTRNPGTQMRDETKMYINCQTRLDPARADRFRRLLKKGVFIDVEGPLVIENKDTPNGKATYIHINTTTAQFPPTMSSNHSAPEQPPVPEQKPSAAQQNPDAFSPARFADDED